MANPVATGKLAPEQAPPAVLFKLVLFAVLMAVIPIGTYFSTLKYAFEGRNSTTYSAICAIVAANVVLVGYVVVAFREDAGEPLNVQSQRIAMQNLEKKKDR